MDQHRIEVEERDGTIVVRPIGELDLSAAAELRDTLARTLDAPTVVVDLGQVTFVDSTIIGVLVLAHKAAQHAGTSLRFLPAGPNVMRTLRIAEVDRLLGFED